MRWIPVGAAAPYEVHIEKGLLDHLGEHMAAQFSNHCQVAIVADDRVDALYGEAVEQSLRGSGFAACRFAFPQGENHKTLDTWQSMLCFLAEAPLTASDVVLALGGGVTGDMAGFAAAAYLRGIPFVQVPTTLLAMVDSSVGGKTGVNLPEGKNLVGAFHQPAAVYCDPNVLETLSRSLLLDGVAEAVKMGVLGDEALFALLSSGMRAEDAEEIIARCVEAKALLVQQDEWDRGKRQLLNLGHTFGHALEWCSGYQMSHGQGVAVGMVYATRLAVRLGMCSEEALGRIPKALTANGLPVEAPYSAEELLAAILRDKKRRGDHLTLVLPKGIGTCVLHPVPVSELKGMICLALGEDQGNEAIERIKRPE